MVAAGSSSRMVGPPSRPRRTTRRSSPTTSRSSSSSSSQGWAARWSLAVVLCWPLAAYFFLSRQDNTTTSSSSNNNSMLAMVRRRDTISNTDTNKAIEVPAEELERRRLLLQTQQQLGYGPTMPRVGVVVVGKNVDHVLRSVESVFRATKWSRILSIIAILDGVEPTPQILTRFDTLALQYTPSSNTNSNSNTNSPMKLKLIIHKKPRGITTCRNHGVHFLQSLAQEYEQVGLKSVEEKVLVLFLRSDAALQQQQQQQVEYGSRQKDWMEPVEQALMVGGPHLFDLLQPTTTTTTQNNNNNANNTTATRWSLPEPPANAISLAVDYADPPEGTVAGGLVTPRRIVRSAPGATVGFDLTLRPSWRYVGGGGVTPLVVPRGGGGGSGNTAEEEEEEVEEEETLTYWTPSLLGAATVMRLELYSQLPTMGGGGASHEEDEVEGEEAVHAAALDTYFAADLELSLNLWLCGDGIDVVPNARVLVDPTILTAKEAQITDLHAARIAYTWMKDIHQKAVFDARTNQGGEQHLVARSKFDRWMQEFKWAEEEEAEGSGHRVKVKNQCRSFAWYASEVNRDVYLAGAMMEEEEDDAAVMGGMEDGAVDQEGNPKGAHRYMRDVNVEIIEKVKPVNIQYVDIRTGHEKEHPHMGAMYPDGTTPNYVLDATSLRKNPPVFEVQPGELERACNKMDSDYQMLHNKIVVDLDAHDEADRSPKPRAKIMCIVYTIEKNHDRIPAIRETWGQKCDGFVVPSTKTVPELSTIELPHAGPEEYHNIWQKVRAIWSYVYDNYYEDYDWFHIGGDDYYLIVENLRLYLESDEIRSAANGGKDPWETSDTMQTPLFLGRRFAEQGNQKSIFNSGGSGYTLNKAALKTIARGLSTCFPNLHTAQEDCVIAVCFRRLGVVPYDTQDDAGGERYMPFKPGHHLHYKIPKGFDWYYAYRMGDLKLGYDHCAAKSLSFHYIDKDLMRRMHAILYGHCDAT